jgi:hypothetical protein
MKGRLLITLVVLAMATVACAGPDLVDGDDASQETESATNEAASSGSSNPAETSAIEPGAGSDDASTSEETADVEPAADQDDQTTPTTDGQSPLVTNPPKETATTSTTSAKASGGGTIDPSLAPFVDQAKTDLAQRLNVEAAAIVVVSAELVEWSDASLGCPQPGMVYAQVPTDGSLIVLSHGGAEYRYHTGGSEYTPFLCE